MFTREKQETTASSFPNNTVLYIKIGLSQMRQPHLFCYFVFLRSISCITTIRMRKKRI